MMSTAAALKRGSAAGVAACVVQVFVGKVEDVALLPPWEDANIAPRLVRRVTDLLGVQTSETSEWALGTAYHVGYGAWWGSAYALAHRRCPVHPLVGGTALGALIYGITFTRWGGAVQLGVERPPERRTDRMTFVAWSVALSFGLTTAFLYGRPQRG